MGLTSLVTGGAGFIGRHVVSELLNQKHEVIVIDDLSGGFEEQISEQAVFLKGSITDTGFVDKVFQENKIDYIYHLAAYAAEGLSHFIRRFNYENNVLGSVNLINAAVKNKVKCFVFTSSIAVYGDQPSPMVEVLTPKPIDPYGIAKYTVEMDLMAAKDMFDLDFVIFRPHNVYGPYQHIGDPYRNVIGIFMNQLLQGKTLTIFGSGEQRRAFSFIDDIAHAMANIINFPDAYNQAFNIGSDKFYTINTLAASVQEAMGIEGEIKRLDARKEVVHAYADHEKLKSIKGLRYGEETPLKNGLSRMAAWAKKVGHRKASAFSQIEIQDNLPPVWQSIIERDGE